MINTELFLKSLPALLKGAAVTLQIAAASCLIGIILGLILGLVQSGKNQFLKSCVAVFVTIIRGTPMLIQIFIVRYLLPEIGIHFSLFWAAVVAIGINSSAYVSQIIRLGIASVPVGQIEAARVLGFSSFAITRLIVLPQAIRVVLPALGNELVTLIKDSSLASVIGVVELTKTGSMIRGVTFDVVTSFAAVGLLYLIMTTLMTIFITMLETRMNAYAKN